MKNKLPLLRERPLPKVNNLKERPQLKATLLLKAKKNQKRLPRR